MALPPPNFTVPYRPPSILEQVLAQAAGAYATQWIQEPFEKRAERRAQGIRHEDLLFANQETLAQGRRLSEQETREAVNSGALVRMTDEIEQEYRRAGIDPNVVQAPLPFGVEASLFNPFPRITSPNRSGDATRPIPTVKREELQQVRSLNTPATTAEAMATDATIAQMARMRGLSVPEYVQRYDRTPGVVTRAEVTALGPLQNAIAFGQGEIDRFLNTEPPGTNLQQAYFRRVIERDEQGNPTPGVPRRLNYQDILAINNAQQWKLRMGQLSNLPANVQEEVRQQIRHAEQLEAESYTRVLDPAAFLETVGRLTSRTPGSETSELLSPYTGRLLNMQRPIVMSEERTRNGQLRYIASPITDEATMRAAFQTREGLAQASVLYNLVGASGMNAVRLFQEDGLPLSIPTLAYLSAMLKAGGSPNYTHEALRGVDPGQFGVMNGVDPREHEQAPAVQTAGPQAPAGAVRPAASSAWAPLPPLPAGAWNRNTAAGTQAYSAIAAANLPQEVRDVPGAAQAVGALASVFANNPLWRAQLMGRWNSTGMHLGPHIRTEQQLNETIDRHIELFQRMGPNGDQVRVQQLRAIRQMPNMQKRTALARLRNEYDAIFSLAGEMAASTVRENDNR
jgi:hypothetical protein